MRKGISERHRRVSCTSGGPVELDKAPLPTLRLKASPPRRAFEDVHRGGYDPAQHLEDMALDGVAGEVLYPSQGLFYFGSHLKQNYETLAERGRGLLSGEVSRPDEEETRRHTI
jgi:hypothetical protein